MDRDKQLKFNTFRRGGKFYMPWKKFVKKPVVIEAVQMNVPFRVETLEGWMVGKEGDWLIKGIKGELYPCDDEIFRMAYGSVEEVLGI